MNPLAFYLLLVLAAVVAAEVPVKVKAKGVDENNDGLDDRFDRDRDGKPDLEEYKGYYGYRSYDRAYPVYRHAVPHYDGYYNHGYGYKAGYFPGYEYDGAYANEPYRY